MIDRDDLLKIVEISKAEKKQQRKDFLKLLLLGSVLGIIASVAIRIIY